MPDRPIVIAGAGSIGCFVGGALASAGRRVSLLARPRMIEEIGRCGLTLTSLGGAPLHVPPERLKLSDDPAILGEAAIVLVTVKSLDTDEVARLIARHAPSDAVTISLQNGISNTTVLRGHLPGKKVLGAMVPFNVVAAGEGRFHRASSGDIVIERDAADTAAQLSVKGLPIRATDNIAGVQWGKLLVNLNNAMDALSGLTLREELAQRSWRMLFADQMAEGLRVVKSEAIHPVSPTTLPLGWVPHLLRLPDALFEALLARVMKIDPQARSSMYDDLRRGRRTEIDFLQGAIIGIAARRGIEVPLTCRILSLIKDAESKREGSPRLTAEQVRSGVGQS